MPQNNRPNSVLNLNKAIHRLASDDKDFVEIRDYFATVVVIQMLSNCVIKGGASLKLRYGSKETRFTDDLDTALKIDNEQFADILQDNLSKGWNGFTGSVIKRPKAHPKNIKEEYVMQPYDIKLAYLNRAFCTVRLEATYNEIDDAEVADMVEANKAGTLFENLGFPQPSVVPLMTINYQIAQKLHGLTEPNSMRVHDLVDLQIIFNRSDIDYIELRNICKRLFAYRAMQEWPPVVQKQIDWSERYKEYTDIKNVDSDLDNAIKWINSIIIDIAKS